MTKQRIALTMAAGLLLAACGGSDGGDQPATAETSTTTIDLVEGAFVRNEGISVDANGDPVEPAGSGSADLEASTTISSETSSPVADGSDPNEPAGGDLTASDVSVGRPDQVEPGQGLIEVGVVAFFFDAETCEFSPELIAIEGVGTATDGLRFAASIVVETVDFDGDDVLESVLDIYVGPEANDGLGNDVTAEYYLSQVGATADGGDATVTYLVDGRRISGSGGILDLNGVASPGDEPVPMSFEASCA